MSAPRFEVVRSDAGWFARFVAANGRKVWQTEVYGRRCAADRAVAMLWEQYTAHDVVERDERTPPPAPLVIEEPIYVGTSMGGYRYWHGQVKYSEPTS